MSIQMNESRTPRPPSALFRLLGLGKRYIPAYIGLLALALIASAGNTGIAELLRRIVNATVSKDTHTLGQSLVLGIALILIMAVSQFTSDCVGSLVDTRSIQSLQEQVLKKIMRLPLKTLHEYHSADLYNRLHDSANTAQSAVNQKGVKLFRDITQIVMIFAYLLYVSAPLAGGAVVIAIILPAAISPFSKRIGTLYWQRQQAQAAEQAFVQESVQGMEIVKGLSLWSSVRTKYLEKSDTRLQRHRHVLVGESILWRVHMLVFVVGLLYALGFGGYLVTQGKLDIGAIAGFLIAFMNVLGPIGEVSSLWPQFQDAIAQSKRVFELLDLPEDDADMDEPDLVRHSSDVSSSPASLSFERVITADILLDHLSFGYRPETPVLRGLHLRIPAGKTTALVGPSGGGKSTIIQLLLRFYRPDDGHLYLGDTDMNDIHPRLWRQDVGFVPQETLVFAGTIYDNIRCGRTGATHEAVMQAADMARVTDFAQALPLGFDTFIGERGLLLSGGERQRLALARAILRDPPVLLLDEPTSALDSENEAMVQAALDKAMRGRTTVVVAHRLSTIQHADQIVFVRDGQVEELGTHQKLLEAKGAYWALHQASRVEHTSDSMTEVAEWRS